MSIKISIVTPSFNQGRFIERTIQSVLSQGIEDLDYVVMDGGSSDETLSILEKYSSQIKFVSEKDRGQSHAVNKGIKATSGEIIGWLNSDDIYYEGALKEVIDFFSTFPQVDVLYGQANHIDEHDAFIEHYPTQPWNPSKLKETCFISQPAVFFRRRIVQNLGLLDENLKYCMDYEYWLRLAHSGAIFSYLPKTLAATRFYSDTKTLGARVPVHHEINIMMRNTFGSVPDRWLFNYAHVILEKKGLTRSNRWLFTPALITLSFYYAWRWNKKISPAMLRSMWGWFCKALKQTFKHAQKT